MALQLTQAVRTNVFCWFQRLDAAMSMCAVEYNHALLTVLG